MQLWYSLYKREGPAHSVYGIKGPLSSRGTLDSATQWIRHATHIQTNKRSITLPSLSACVCVFTDGSFNKSVRVPSTWELPRYSTPPLQAREDLYRPPPGPPLIKYSTPHLRAVIELIFNCFIREHSPAFKNHKVFYDIRLLFFFCILHQHATAVSVIMVSSNKFNISQL